jgi:phage gpG-like protein
MRALDGDIVVFGEPVIRRRLVRFQNKVTHPVDGLARVARILEEGTRQNFATRGASGGSPWRDLAPSTVARKRREGLDPRILRATGRLYASLVGHGPDHVESISGGQLTWGSRVPYGVFHQSSGPRTRLPYRPPVRLSQRMRRDAVRAMQQALVS